MNKDQILLENAYRSIYEENESVMDAVDKIRNFLSNGATFANFIYQSQGTTNKKKGEAPNGPISIYHVNFGISVNNIYSENANLLRQYTPVDQWEEQAVAQMLGMYTKEYVPKTDEEQEESAYITLGKGIRYNQQHDHINILGRTVGYPIVIKDGQKKPNPADGVRMTKKGTPWGGDAAYVAHAKREIEKKLKQAGTPLRRMESFDFDENKISALIIKGHDLVFNPGDDGEPEGNPINFIANAPAPKKEEAVAPEQAAPQAEEPAV